MKLFKILILISILTLPVLARPQAGEYLTINLADVPAQTTQAYLTLDEETALPLTKSSADRWEGSFVILPGLYDGVARPRVVLRDGQDRLLSTVGMKQQLASSLLLPENLSLALSQDNTQVVIDSRVNPGMLRLQTWSGQEYAPIVGLDTLTLPSGLNPNSVAGIKSVSYTHLTLPTIYSV